MKSQLKRTITILMLVCFLVSLTTTAAMAASSSKVQKVNMEPVGITTIKNGNSAYSVIIDLNDPSSMITVNPSSVIGSSGSNSGSCSAGGGIPVVRIGAGRSDRGGSTGLPDKNLNGKGKNAGTTKKPQ